MQLIMYKTLRGLKEVHYMNYCKAKIDRLETCKRIRNIIMESSLSVEEIAEMLDFSSPRIIYYWFNGSKIPNVESLYNLSKIFDMKMEDFLVMR